MAGKTRKGTYRWYMVAVLWAAIVAGLFMVKSELEASVALLPQPAVVDGSSAALQGATGSAQAATMLHGAAVAGQAAARPPLPERQAAAGAGLAPEAEQNVLLRELPLEGTPTPTITGTPPTHTPTRTPTATPSPSATPCSSGAIANGGFETGSLSPWVALGTNPAPVVSSALAHSGTYSALLGTVTGPEPLGDGSIYQQFTVPADGGTLSYWWNGGTTDTITFDWQDAYITNTSGAILATIMHNCETTPGWVNQTFDMAAYAGQMVRIEFLVHQDGFTDDTYMYVDDVLLALTTCPTSTPTPTNTPTYTPTNTPTDTSTSTSTTLPVATPTTCTVTFTDVLPDSTFYPYIHCLACLGIINGYSDGSFKPNNQVTRGQLSKIVANSAGFNDPQPNRMFQDVPLGSTFQLFIGRLASKGYISGYPCGGSGEPCVPPGNLPYFRPNNNATRGQISKIDSNAAGFNDPPSGRQFEDIPVGSTYYSYTYRLVSRGVMSGYPCGGAGEPCIPPDNLPYFRPNNNATRGQTSKIVANTFFPGCSLSGGSAK